MIAIDGWILFCDQALVGVTWVSTCNMDFNPCCNPIWKPFSRALKVMKPTCLIFVVLLHCKACYVVYYTSGSACYLVNRKSDVSSVLLRAHCSSSGNIYQDVETRCLGQKLSHVNPNDNLACSLRDFVVKYKMKMAMRNKESPTSDKRSIMARRA